MAIFQISLLCVGRVLADPLAPLGFGDAARNGVNDNFVTWDASYSGNLGPVKTGNGNQTKTEAFRFQIKILGGVTSFQINIIIVADVIKGLGHNLHVAADDQERGWISGGILTDSFSQWGAEVAFFQ